MSETELRSKIVQRLRQNYPNTEINWQWFLNGQKASIDSWIGDAFAHFSNELRWTEEEYNKWRKSLFNE